MSMVLVVARDARIVRMLRELLDADQYRVHVVDMSAATGVLSQQRPHVVIVDLEGTRGEATATCTPLRAHTNAPLLALSAHGGSDHRARVLDGGADDCLAKPFGTAELLARMRAVARRSSGDVATSCRDVVRAAAFTVELTAKTVRCQGVAVHLTPTEWAVLEVLVRNEGRLVSQRELLSMVWGPAYAEETHYLRVYLGQLRGKLEAEPSEPRHLRTKPGRGYHFER